eukprot:6183412-Pleurochrysis_carterae.AAC.2
MPHVAARKIRSDWATPCSSGDVFTSIIPQMSCAFATAARQFGLRLKRRATSERDGGPTRASAAVAGPGSHKRSSRHHAWAGGSAGLVSEMSGTEWHGIATDLRQSCPRLGSVTCVLADSTRQMQGELQLDQGQDAEETGREQRELGTRKGRRERERSSEGSEAGERASE